jgi:hypothetical protein
MAKWMPAKGKGRFARKVENRLDIAKAFRDFAPRPAGHSQGFIRASQKLNLLF